ncbi:20765_t:CDS:2 [Cetraspora pellucida]|uniref:20765_t:CDS:1 n=1 Tax=Cetraspora pellucida TaxID=1433469 RepID=A0A9N8VMB6_9GLOM|nr:20765_t:CDS:2 [Cetraspora pellucida]
MTNSTKLNSIICCSLPFKRPKDKSVKNDQDIIINNYQVDINEELDQKKLYGVCKTCGTSLSNKAWCKTCEGQKLQKKLGEWTSGNEYVDKFIRNTQTKPLNKDSYLSWIPFMNLSQLKYMANGGFSAVYHALWDNLENNYLIDVVLKRLHNVMEYADEGDLRGYIRQQHLLWSDRMYMLRDIARALDFLHSREFVHGDLHTGNVLKTSSEKKSLINLLTKKRFRERDVVLDLSLAYIPDMSTTPLYGVMPYVAPEVFSKGYYTKASDIYSFGLIMWELAVGQTPFSEYKHDKDLVSDICNGVRPDIDRSIPQFYVDLMSICWDANPEKRPNSRVLRGTIEDWILSSDKSLCNRLSSDSKDLVKQLKDADTLAKKQFKRQAETPILMPPPPTFSASLFTSKSLNPFVTAPEGGLPSIRKVSSSTNYPEVLILAKILLAKKTYTSVQKILMV